MSVHLLKGSDPVLLEDAAVELTRELLGDADRSEVLDEFRGDDYEVGEMVLAASTVSMFGDRVVVARNLGRFASAELAPVVELLGDPPDGTALVLVWDRPGAPGARANPVPKKVSDAVKAAGGSVVDTSAPSGKGRDGWYREQFARAGVDLDGRAQKLVRETLGDDVGRLPALLNLLASTHPGGSDLGEDDVAPYLGEGGGVPPWDLTDAIDKGSTARAVELTRRMLGGGARHPLQVMVTLQTHFERMLRLDGASVHTDKEAAALLGMKGSTYPAKKAMQQGAKLGTARLARATQLLATADVELRGATGTPPEAVLELLVARLAALSSRR
ncbi:MAG: DNA polymerase III subunit delta [Microthrixaceae bacterium]